MRQLRSSLRTKDIEMHRDFNCWQIKGSDCCFLLGGRTDGSKPQEVYLPYFVRLRNDPKLRRWLNQNNKGWYSGREGCFWFELDIDAVTAKFIWGE